MSNKRFELHCGDCRSVLAVLPDNSVDSIVTDPPYHLTSNARGSHKGGDATTPHLRTRIGDRGFMGHMWDGGDIAHSVEMWAECVRVLKPGGHLLAFSGTRTQHRMVCAIEDAGFEVRDQIGWLYGSGFPKSKNLSGDWEGWGTAAKPAWEPIALARKPFKGPVVANVLQHGTGALNIDACRVPSGPDHAEKCASVVGLASNRNGNAYGEWTGEREDSYSPLGRWPANIIHDGLSEDWARFFYCAKASRVDRNEGLPDPGPQFQHGSTLRDAENLVAERGGNHHPTVKPTDLMAYLCRLVTPPGGTVLDHFMGSGSTGKAAMREGFRFIGIDMTPEYVEIARARIQFEFDRVEQARAESARQPGLFSEVA
jgi:site-specific DNA-methyltransferase (adenine-specific)